MPIHCRSQKEDESERRDGTTVRGEEEWDDDGTHLHHRSFGKIRDGNLVKSGRPRTSLFREPKSVPICQIGFVISDCVSK